MSIAYSDVRAILQFVSRVVVHPGFVRTATTTLQDAFQTLQGVNYFGIPFRHEAIEGALKAMLMADGTRYQADAARQALQQHAENDRLNVISYENLASFKAKDKAMVAQRLKAVFPEARIIFTIRNQRDMVRSWYLLKRARTACVPFDDWWARAGRNPHRSILDDVNFDEIVRCYEGLFGVEHVGVFLYEQLRDDPDAFAANMAAFAGIDAVALAAALKSRHLNAGMTARQLAWGRARADWVPDALATWWHRHEPKGVARRFEAWQARGDRAQVSLRKKQDQLLSSLCAEGNRRLMTQRGLPLAEYGYPLTP